MTEVGDDEQALLATWRAGDARAGQVLFRRHYVRLSRFFRSKAGDAAFELAQATFLACVEARGAIRGASSLSNPLPLRLYAGGNFFNTYQKKELIQNPMPLKWSNINSDKSAKPDFSLALTSQLHKMAVASKIVKTGEPLTPDRVDELLGKTLQFIVQVGRNDKGYYFEKLGFVVQSRKRTYRSRMLPRSWCSSGKRTMLKF